MKKQLLPSILVATLALGSAASALGQTGFYGGVALREAGTAESGLSLGSVPLAWSRFAPAPLTDEPSQRSLVYGGYRWQSDLALEAAFNSSDRVALKSAPGAPAGGVGLGFADSSSRSWNADVYTSWEFLRNVSLYGRLGYAQAETRPLFAGASLVPGDARRSREGVNYGLGLRYDFTRSLGMRAEYARYSHFTGDALSTGVLPDSDQLTLGIQFKF